MRITRLPQKTQGATATSHPGAAAVAGEGVEFVALVDFTAVAGEGEVVPPVRELLFRL